MARQLSPRRAQRLANALTGIWARKLDRESLLASAIVFSPHQDDETLGCGGTILKKRQLGARVQVVYMTDGAASPPTTPVPDLKLVREREARAACQQLGLEQEHVTFLQLADGHLLDDQERTIERVKKVLGDRPAEQVYIPYRQDRDPNLDHVATNQVVRSVLLQLGRPTAVLEYPIWYWRFWPQARVPVRGRPGTWETQRRSLLPNLRSLADLNVYVELDGVRGSKEAALNQHRSQVEGLRSIQSGAFVEWFFGKRELFYRYSLPGHG